MNPVTDLADALGPGWKQWALVLTFVVFVLGLLGERLLFMTGLRRDVNEIKDDLPKMKADIKEAKDKANESERQAALAEQRSGHAEELAERLEKKLDDMPGKVMEMFREAALHVSLGDLRNR